MRRGTRRGSDSASGGDEFATATPAVQGRLRITRQAGRQRRQASCAAGRAVSSPALRHRHADRQDAPARTAQCSSPVRRGRVERARLTAALPRSGYSGAAHKSVWCTYPARASRSAAHRLRRFIHRRCSAAAYTSVQSARVSAWRATLGASGWRYVVRHPLACRATRREG